TDRVFDLWIQRWRKRRADGDVVVVRFADDFVVGFEHRQEAEPFLDELRERFARFGLELHPDKTRLFSAATPSGSGAPVGVRSPEPSTSSGSLTAVGKLVAEGSSCFDRSCSRRRRARRRRSRRAGSRAV